MLIISGTELTEPADNPAGLVWSDRPAERWFEALPIGNGRLGGMVFGGTGRERVQLSESTAWSGAPASTDVSPTALEELPRIRQLLLTGQYAEAQRLTEQHLLGRPTSFGTNVPLPEVWLDLAGSGEFSGYRRSLDLDTGIVSTTYRQGQLSLARETFASNPHGVMAIRLSADQGGQVGLSLSLQPDVLPGTVEVGEDGLRFVGHAFERLHSNGRQGVRLEIGIKVLASGGEFVRRDGALELVGADEAVVIVAVGTDWEGADPTADVDALLSGAATTGFAELKRAHVEDHRALMGRMSLDLGPTPPEVAALPTDERRRRLASGQTDDELIALYFQYGRYLTMAGSRANSPLPLALQGVWNDGLASSAPWTNDFHLDINTQQNYWAAEPTNLSECQEPVLRFVERLAEAGQATAKQMYGAPGWVAHTVTNAWCYTAPGSGIGWGLDVTGGAWLALQLWEHYEYTGDEDFLRDRVYPVFHEAAQFFLSYLVREPEHGWLVSGPSDSPENWYLTPDGDECSVSMGNTADRVLIDAVLRICADAARLLDVDPELRETITAARAALPPFQIGKHGQLQEWLHDLTEADPAHRHTSHVHALFPERQIGPRSTPELAAAAEVTIERRQSAAGWERTEWVEANFTVFYARLLKGDAALAHLKGLITGASEANLMSYSEGGIAGAAQNIYSFDGNAGGTAGVAEMLLQSDGYELELLPALPTTWPTGAVRGLRARGGFTVDISWRDGRLDAARVVASKAATLQIRYGAEVIACSLGGEQAIVLNTES